jgi:hypothetical protein
VAGAGARRENKNLSNDFCSGTGVFRVLNLLSGGKVTMQKKMLLLAAALLSAFMLCAAILISADGERIECTAMGTSTQMGKQFNLQITIDSFSTEEERAALIQAFQTEKNPGLAKALGKLPTRGRIQTPGTTGYELKFIRLIPNSPAGTRRIRIMTDRPISLVESRNQTRSLDYNLSAVDLDLNQDASKSKGVLLPLCEFKLDKKTKEFTVEVRQNPFNLINFLDRK